jgi:hypothetical protein
MHSKINGTEQLTLDQGGNTQRISLSCKCKHATRNAIELQLKTSTLLFFAPRSKQ